MTFIGVRGGPVRLAAVLLGLVLMLAIAGTAWAVDLQFPTLTGRVTDAAAVLSPATRSRLTGLLAAHEAATGQQVVVATVRSLQGDSIEDYANRLFRAWGIGSKARNDGVLLLVAPHERKLRIEVGYGLEGTLTDARSKLIISGQIEPAFRQGNIDRGVSDGTTAILAVLRGDAPPPAAKAGKHGGGPSISFIFAFVGIWVLALLLIIYQVIFGKRRRVRQADGTWRSVAASSRSSSGSGSDDFSGGGGSSGGGGASGSW